MQQPLIRIDFCPTSEEVYTKLISGGEIVISFGYWQGDDFMIANREALQIEQELRTTRRSPRATRLAPPSDGPKIDTIVPDHALRIRMYRKSKYPSARNANSLVEMAKASRGNFSRTSLERFESGIKPSMEEARVLERLFKGLELVEAMSKKDSPLSELEKFLEIHGISHAEEETAQGSFQSQYFDFLAPHYAAAKTILIDAYKNSREIESEGTWNGIRKWDASTDCNVQGCNGHVPLTPVSNTKDFYNDTIEAIKQWLAASINDIPDEWLNDGETTADAKKRILEEWNEHLENDETGVLNFQNQSVNTFNIRGAFRTLIWENAKETTFGDYTLNLYDFSSPAGSDFEYSSRGEFSDLELRAIHSSGDIKAAKIAHRLNICGDRKRIPTCSECGTTRWGLSKKTHITEDGNFCQISEIATKTIIESLVGSPARLMDSQYTARDASGKKHLISTSGAIMGITRKEIKQQISDAIGLSLDLLGSFELPSPHGALTVNAADNTATKIYSAPNTNVVGHLAQQLKQFKPLLQFLDEDNPYLAQDAWAGKSAAQILHAFGAKAHLFETRRSRNLVYTNGETPKHELNMLTLTPKISEEIRERFVSQNSDGTVRNMLEEFLREDTNLPMLCPPRDHNSLGGGGYLSKAMRLRYPMISNDTQETMLGHRRFQPSDEAIQVLNFLQETEWAADEQVMNIALELLKSVAHKNIIENLRSQYPENEDKNGEKTLAFILDAQPKLTQNQVYAWTKTGDFVNQHFSNPAKPMSFYHPWNFEWRGRMMTSTTILSPQNDDLARGVLRFARPKPLDDEGWLWLQRHTAALMRGQKIDKVPALQHLKDEWKTIQSILSDKTWDAYDKACNVPAFRGVIDLIASSPMETFGAWGEGDIFTAKCEGFQRLSACLTLSRAYSAGGVGAEVNLPISHDASSSIYQHTSALVRDKKMAEAVNVLPQEDGKPADVYEKIIEDMKARWKEKGNPLEKIGMSPAAAANLTKTLLNRKFAKKPVMTRGYGATGFGITGSFLTHNGKTNGIFGPMVFVDKKTNKEVPVPEDRDTIERKKQWWRPTAHPASLLGSALAEVELALHFPVAQIIVAEIDKSMEKILPGMNVMGTFFEGEYDDVAKECVASYQATGIPKHAHVNISWELADGCKVRNLKLSGNELEVISSWEGNISPVEERAEARLKVTELLRSMGHASVLNEKGRYTSKELREALSIPQYKENGQRLRGKMSSLIDNFGSHSDEGQKRELVAALNKSEALSQRPTYSRRKIGTTRDENGEMRGLSPNFIHSHDACHMRLVLDKLQSAGVQNVWSVHDAFGAHPNHMSDLRRFAVSSFVETHKAKNPQGTLSQINTQRFEDLISPTMDIDDVAQLDQSNQPVSQYLIS